MSKNKRVWKTTRVRESQVKAMTFDGWKRTGFVVDHLDYLPFLDVSEERRDFIRRQGDKPREIYEDIAANAAYAVFLSTKYKVWWAEHGKLWLEEKPDDAKEVAWQYNDMLLTFLEDISPEVEAQVWRQLKYNTPKTGRYGYRIPSALVRLGAIEWLDPDRMEGR